MTKFLYTGQLTERKAVFISSVEKTAVRLRTMQPPPVSRARVSGLACKSMGFSFASIGICAREFRFARNYILICALSSSWGIITAGSSESIGEFDERLWAAVTDKVTVMPDGALVFGFNDGTDITIGEE